MEKHGKKFGYFPVGKSSFGSVSMEKENNFPDLVFLHTLS